MRYLYIIYNGYIITCGINALFSTNAVPGSEDIRGSDLKTKLRTLFSPKLQDLINVTFLENVPYFIHREVTQIKHVIEQKEEKICMRSNICLYCQIALFMSKALR